MKSTKPMTLETALAHNQVQPGSQDFVSVQDVSAPPPLTPYEEGWLAGCYKKFITTAPYHIRSDKWYEWTRGWKDGRDGLDPQDPSKA